MKTEPITQIGAPACLEPIDQLIAAQHQEQHGQLAHHPVAPWFGPAWGSQSTDLSPQASVLWWGGLIIASLATMNISPVASGLFAAAALSGTGYLLGWGDEGSDSE